MRSCPSAVVHVAEPEKLATDARTPAPPRRMTQATSTSPHEAAREIPWAARECVRGPSPERLGAP
eukprot:10828908-Alexandrium_andersonii.AAC.1